MARPLAAFFGDKPLRKVPPTDLSLSRMFGGISDERRRRPTASYRQRRVTAIVEMHARQAG
jgi:hypothetical protein